MAKKQKTSPWLITLFALPFAGVGIGFLVFSIAPALYDWAVMSQWQAVEANVIAAKTETHYGDDSTSYEATAHYRYQVNGKDYVASRVGIMSGADNIGDWQQQRGQQLEKAQRTSTAIHAYVNPAAPEQAVIFRDMRWGLIGFKSIFVVIFGGLGVGLIWFAWRPKKAAEDNGQHAAEPWQTHKPWANPVSSSSKLGLIVIVGFAVFWNALSAPVLFAIPEELQKQNYPMLFALLFPLIGIGLVVIAVVKLRQWKRFGAVPLHMDPWPGVLGGQVGGTLAFKLPYDAEQLVQLTLLCVNSYYSGSGKNRTRNERVIWQAEGLANLEPAPQGSKIGFYFDVPANLPASQLPEENYHLWRLEVRAELPGADFEQSYEVPVFAGETQSGAARRCASQHPKMQSLRAQRLGDLLNARQIPEGVELNYRMFRRLAGRLTGFLVGVVLAIAGWFMWTHDAAPVIAVIIQLAGWLVVLTCLYGIFNSYKVKLGKRGVYAQRKILGVPVSMRFFPADCIEGLQIKSHGSSQIGNTHAQHFVIDAVLKNKKRVRVVEMLDGHLMATEALESVSLLSGLPIKK